MRGFLPSRSEQRSSKSDEQGVSHAFAMGQPLLPVPRRGSFWMTIKEMILKTAEPVHVLNSGKGHKVYFPQELIGGVCPWVEGQEEEIVWRAAAAACGAERIHAVWQVFQNKIFYLAIKSEEMASHYNTWCPFAALLPGMPDTTAAPVCYTYYANGSAAMMIVTADSLQIYRGISLIARAKAERSSRELNNAPIIELTPARVALLTPSPWHSVSLFEDRTRRILSAISVMSALGIACLAFLVWIFACYSFVNARVKIATREDHLQKDAAQFIRTLDSVRSNPLHRQLADFVHVNDGLLVLNGLMVTYQVKNGQSYWRASVDASVSEEAVQNLGAAVIQPAENGKMVIGYGAEALYTASPGKGP